MTYIIILTWNGKKYLEKLFKSLENLSYPKDKYKVLVLDSGSTDGTVFHLEKLEAKGQIELIKLKKNLGFTGGNNVGMQHALDKGAENIVLLNQDTYIEPDFLEHLIAKANSDDQIGIVQPLILHYKEIDQIQSLGNQLHYLGYGWSGGNWLKLNETSVQEKSDEIMVYASGAAVLYTAKMLKEIGLFDENYFSYHEDTDICLRAKLRNYKVVLADKSVVYHDYDFPTDKNKIRYYWNEKNRIYLIKKFYTKRTFVILWPMRFFMACGQLVFAIKNGYTWEWLKSRLWFLVNSEKLNKQRDRVQNTRKIPDSELIHNFASEIIYQSVANPLLEKIANPIMKCYWWVVKKII